MNKLFILVIMIGLVSRQSVKTGEIITVNGSIPAKQMGCTLEHEHLFIDYSEPDSINAERYDQDEALEKISPFLEEAKSHGVNTIVECTPKNIGRNVRILKKLSETTGLNILTNTGFYGAFNNKYMPQQILYMSANDIAKLWINEFEQGIDGTGIRPGFIKIAVDRKPLSEFHTTLVRAAAITHKATGLTIMSHTGPSIGAFQQLAILKEEGVSPDAFIWTHACNEKEWIKLVEAAKMGCWISLDKYGWEPEELKGESLVFLKEQGVLNKVLISHDAGWYEPENQNKKFKPFTNIFETLIPNLKEKGFTHEDIDLLLVKNPAKAFTVKKRLLN